MTNEEIYYAIKIFGYKFGLYLFIIALAIFVTLRIVMWLGDRNMRD